MSNTRRIRVAVDAMGGDHAPAEVVAGAVEAAKYDEVEILLVGDTKIVDAEMEKHDVSGCPVARVASEGVITESDQPAVALRRKPHASLPVSIGLVSQNRVDASVTMGSTGAAMAASAVVLGVMEGVGRPSIGGPIVGLAPHTVIIDLGANVDCRSTQMASFGVMGDVFARLYWDIESPRVALLSVGSEAEKGNRQTREVRELLENSGLNFIGNVEPNDLPFSKADVVVCDGFVGNVVMKLTEGLGAAISDHIRLLMKDVIGGSEVDLVARKIYELTNFVETIGGGPILGVNGVSVVGHGRAKSDSVRRAISTAKRTVEVGFVAKLRDKLAGVHNMTNG